MLWASAATESELCGCAQQPGDDLQSAGAARRGGGLLRASASAKAGLRGGPLQFVERAAGARRFNGRLAGVRVAVEDGRAARANVRPAEMGGTAAGGKDALAVRRARAGRHDPIHSLCEVAEGGRCDGCPAVPAAADSAAVELRLD